MDTKEKCACGHEETYHKEGDGYCFGFSCRNGVGCIAFRPAPSQPSMKVSGHKEGCSHQSCEKDGLSAYQCLCDCVLAPKKENKTIQ